MSDDDEPAPLPRRAGLNKNVFKLPVLQEGELWKLTPSVRFNLTRDHSSAAENGVKATFPHDDVFSADCMFHGSPSHWSKEHKDLFKSGVKAERNKKITELNADYEYLKNCPHIHLIPVLKKELLTYWKDRKGRNELRWAEAWEKTYKNSNLSRVLVSEHYALRGGMPGDNNIIERSNRNDKEIRSYQRKGPVAFITETIRHVREESQTDKYFYGDLKSAVHSGIFMTHVGLTCESEKNNHPCLLNLQFSITAVAQGIPLGSVLVPKYRLIYEMRRERGSDLTIEDCCELMNPRTFRHQQGTTSMVDTYRQLVRDPSRTFDCWKAEKIDYKPHTGFEYLKEWCSKFCCLRPIDCSAHYGAVDSLRTILVNNNYSVIPTDDIAKLKTKGLVSCDCRKYLHYAWCYHACAVAVSRRIIIAYPKNLDPRQAFGGGNKKKRGRPANARKRGALERE